MDDSGTSWGGWEEHRRAQRRSLSRTSVEERLHWLDEVIELARRTGALPRPRDPWTGMIIDPQGHRSRRSGE